MTGLGLFDDRTATIGLGAPSLAYTGFGAAWLDFDNDGWLDLLAVNGAVQASHQRFAGRAAAGSPRGRRSRCRSTSRTSSSAISGTGGSTRSRGGPVHVFGLSEVSRGAAFGDIDNEGDVDVLVTNNNGPTRLLINEVGKRGRWIGPPACRRASVAGTCSARGSGSSATTVLRCGAARGQTAAMPRPTTRECWWGWATAAAVRRVRVVWPSGREEDWTDLPVDGWLTLEEGEGESRE